MKNRINRPLLFALAAVMLIASVTVFFISEENCDTDGAVVRNVEYGTPLTQEMTSSSPCELSRPVPTNMMLAGQSIVANQTGMEADVSSVPGLDCFPSIYNRTATYLLDGETILKEEHTMGVMLNVREQFFLQGHTVTPWTTDDVEVEEGRFILCRDVVFSATSSPNTYKVTYHLLNGTGPDPIVYDVVYGAPVPVPETPTRLGYDFEGWGEEIPDTMPAMDLEYSAVWVFPAFPCEFSETVPASKMSAGRCTATTFDTEP